MVSRRSSPSPISLAISSYCRPAVEVVLGLVERLGAVRLHGAAVLRHAEEAQVLAVRARPRRVALSASFFCCASTCSSRREVAGADLEVLLQLLAILLA